MNFLDYLKTFLEIINVDYSGITFLKKFPFKDVMDCLNIFILKDFVYDIVILICLILKPLFTSFILFDVFINLFMFYVLFQINILIGRSMFFLFHRLRRITIKIIRNY